MDQDILNQLAQIKAGVQQNSEQISSLSIKIDDQNASLNAKIDERVGSVNAKIDGQVASLGLKIDSQSASLNAKIDEVVESIGNFSNSVDGRFDRVESRLEKVESNMVTKDYLDEKISDLKGDITVLMRKEDKKLAALVDLLKFKKVLTQQEAENIFGMEPFPQTQSPIDITSCNDTLSFPSA